MSTIPLPERPHIEQMKKRAKEIGREFGIPLHKAQLNMARGYGFASWPKLAKHVEVVTALTREPETVAPDDFLALVCLTYGDDAPSRRSRGLDMLADSPSLATRDIWSAAATASAATVQRCIADASRQGGPFAWEPLMYLCYSRVPSIERDVLATASALLDAGADPNVGYLWHGLPSPFTALTGVLGSGEADQPAHEHWQSLARLLLERGANANDPQTLYNRQFRPGQEHLELLFEFGLGRGDGGPWRERLTAAMDSPGEMLRDQLRWAIHHNMLERVRLLAENGVDLNSPFDDPRFEHAYKQTPARFAALCGNSRIVDELAKHDAPVLGCSAPHALIGSVMCGWREAALSHARSRRKAIAERPSLVVQAAATGRKSAVRLAVERNDAEMVESLLKLGADPSIEDARFHATPKGWAEHFGHEAIAALF